MKYRLFFFLKGKNTRMKKARKEGKKRRQEEDAFGSAMIVKTRGKSPS